EVFITMVTEGSTIGGRIDAIATLVSVYLQYGVHVESLVRKFEHVRFEPSGMTRNLDIPMAKSLVDYIFRWLAMEFIPGYRAANAPKREQKGPGFVSSGSVKTESPGEEADDAGRATMSPSDPRTLSPASPTQKDGTGHARRIAPH